MIDLNRARKFSEEVAKEAGHFLLENQKKVQIKAYKAYKDRQDIVTNVDLASEKIIISAIEKKYPKHNIHSEEKGVLDKKSQYTWVIDPLDGTKEYLRGLPIYSINLSLEDKKEILLGTVYVPKAKSMFSALRNRGAFENGKRIKVSSQNKLKDSFIYTHLPVKERKLSDSLEVIWSKLEKIFNFCYRLRSFQIDILSLCWLAKGGLDGYVLFFKDEKWWDIAAGLLILEEAGGKITDIFGKTISNNDLSNGIVASNAQIHDQLIKILNQ